MAEFCLGGIDPHRRKRQVVANMQPLSVKIGWKYANPKNRGWTSAGTRGPEAAECRHGHVACRSILQADSEVVGRPGPNLPVRQGAAGQEGLGFRPSWAISDR